jgi:hypothetical protein
MNSGYDGCTFTNNSPFLLFLMLVFSTLAKDIKMFYIACFSHEQLSPLFFIQKAMDTF